MTAMMNNTSSYLDFFDIALDAYESKEIDIYRKLMTTLISSYKTLLYDIEIENNDLENVEHLTIQEEDLDLFYDMMYEMVDLVKLLKKHILPVKDKDGLFNDLYQTVEKLHEAIILHIDLISTQEVKAIQSRYVKAS
ncbi:hypothetical protein [Sulfurovum sp.]|jgi:hypothetical protein|uniref:hypothetical protein n=1 Tax=Sulfurovum sp. TaxID=1969726 RepID=UPI002A358AB6|nr:hypothetical protein [Sulfurovum sp.]MDY0402422.1 hypothetical protein [Sulfurovum sp.]